MTLQYRIRSKFEDDRWRLRVRLCTLLILESIDEWCKSDSIFSVDECVRCCVHLFSNRCDLAAIGDHSVKTRLLSLSREATEEYAIEWPLRSNTESQALIESMALVLKEAETVWEKQGLAAISAESVTNQLVNEIVRQQFVVFHRKESAQRDTNHWGI